MRRAACSTRSTCDISTGAVRRHTLGHACPTSTAQFINLKRTHAPHLLRPDRHGGVLPMRCHAQAC